MGIRTVQEQNRVLCLLHSLPGRGDWHRSLDRPESGLFSAKDLRLKLELDGVGVRAAKGADGTLSLSAGDHQLLVVPAECQFLGEALRWEVVNEGNLSAVEGVCYSGAERKFDFRDLIDIRLAFGLCLEKAEPSQELAIPEMKLGHQRIDASWAGLKVAVPAPAK